MKNFILSAPGRLVAVLVVFLLSCSFLSADPIEGQWINSTGDVVIDVKVKDGALVGILLYWGDDGGSRVDSKNPDESLRDRALKGIPVLWGLVKKGEEWEGGRIYNASDGKSYSAKLWFVGEDEIEVRAFVGASLFGKTTKWTRK